MRVVIAPDSFSGTLSAVGAADAVAHGWRRARPADDLVLRPMSDGGQGLLDVVRHAVPAVEVHQIEVADARGLARVVEWLVLPDGTALVETARVVGLHDLEPADRDPLRTTSYGVGQVLCEVGGHDPGRVVVGLGGTATVDGGAGMVAALTGHALRRADGNGVRVGGRWAGQAATVRRPLDLPAGLSTVVLASDVTNPLLGPRGAAAVFGPQKGASAEAVGELERALTRLADVIERDLGGRWRDRPGAGAAGGLGFACMAVLGAEVRSGAEVVAELVGLDLADADLVVTGEGRLDAQTASGKVPAAVAGMARASGARVAVVAGDITDGADAPYDLVEALGTGGLADPVGALRAAGERLALRAG